MTNKRKKQHDISIYCITNKTNPLKTYVGRTFDMNKRRYHHFDGKNIKKTNKKLRADMDKIGKEHFSMQTLDKRTFINSKSAVKWANIREAEFIKDKQAYTDGYNYSRGNCNKAGNIHDYIQKNKILKETSSSSNSSS